MTYSGRPGDGGAGQLARDRLAPDDALRLANDRGPADQRHRLRVAHWSSAGAPWVFHSSFFMLVPGFRLGNAGSRVRGQSGVLTRRQAPEYGYTLGAIR